MSVIRFSRIEDISADKFFFSGAAWDFGAVRSDEVLRLCSEICDVYLPVEFYFTWFDDRNCLEKKRINEERSDNFRCFDADSTAFDR
jgi:hypothetical protein